jgi:1-acyl-sn-glycerol-3-phosphate acyltransferase
MRLATSLLSGYVYAEFVGCVLAFLPIMRAVHLTDRDPAQRRSGQWMRRFGRAASRLNPAWRFSVETELAPKDIATRAYVVVSNHESQADPFLLCFLPWDMRWVAKEELYKQPLIGSLMRNGGDIPIRRGERDSVTKMMEECARTLEHGLSIMMFPEGTRSATGDLLPFKDGAFQLAIRTGAPILPMALAGTHLCRPKGSAEIRVAKAIVRALPAIETTGMTADDVPRLRDQARATIAAALPDVRRRVGIVSSPGDAPKPSNAAGGTRASSAPSQ